MKNNVATNSLLTEADDSILVVIDVQREFLDKLDSAWCAPIVNRIGWITEMAGRFEIPMVVTAEDTDNNKGTVPQVAEKFTPGVKEFNKMSYGLAAEPDILKAIEKTGRKTTVLVGFETDVCICQSALGLLEHGYRVVVLADAVGSQEPCHDYGIERMRDAGVIVSSVKGTFYEWQRTVQCGNTKFKDVYTAKQPDGIYL